MAVNGRDKRRLRHLFAISIRNLLATPPQFHSSNQPFSPEPIIDDSCLEPLSSKVDEKGSSFFDVPKVPRSHSAINMTSAGSEDMPSKNTGTQMNGGIEGTSTGRVPKTRRRSTLSWGKESPAHGQDRFENMISARRMPVFVSLHETKSSLPFYITETVDKTMNTTFRAFDLMELRSMVRLDNFVLKLWAQEEMTLNFVQVLEHHVQMGSLVCIGKSLEDAIEPMNDNTVLFHLTTGVFVDPACMDKIKVPRPPPTIIKELKAKKVPTSSFDALMQIQNISDCIDDALSTRDVITNQIQQLIDKQKISDDTTSRACTATASKNNAEEAVVNVKREERFAAANVAKIAETLRQRNARLQKEKDHIKEQEKRLSQDQAASQELISQQDETRTLLKGQIRRIVKRTAELFPIEPIEGYPLCFTICGLYLPNAQHFATSPTPQQSSSRSATPRIDDDEVAAAFGFVVHVVDLLATKLFVALPYSLQICSSSSTIFDPLSPDDLIASVSDTRSAAARGATKLTPENSPQRVFVLSQKISRPRRFSWGVYLVNKCIEELLSRVGLKMVDPRETLGNLKYLLTVLGDDGTTERKTGSVEGLRERLETLPSA